MLSGRVSIGAVNGPSSLVISGNQGTVLEIAAGFRRRAAEPSGCGYRMHSTLP